MFRTVTATLMLTLGISVVPAMAAEPDAGTLMASASLAATAAASSEAVSEAASEVASDTNWALPALHVGTAPATTSRGALLPMFYVSLAALNVYDAHSTRTGLSHGAVEGNPTMRGVAGSPVALWAAKGAATASAIVMAEHLWKTHRKGQAIGVMLLSNCVMAAVAAHNAHVVASIR